MKIKVKFYAVFRDLFGADEKEVEVSDEKAKLANVVDALCDSRKCRETVVDENGKIKSDIKILKKGRKTVFLSNVDAEIEEGDTIIFLPPAFGG